MNGAESKAPAVNDGLAETIESSPPSSIGRALRVVFKTLLWLFVILVALLVLSAVAGPLVEIPLLLAFGWIVFLHDIAESAELNRTMMVEGAVVVVALAVGGHYFARWLYSELVPAAREPWRARWTAGGFGLVLLLFVAGIATIGLTHQTAWLFMRTDPFIENTFSVRVKIQEGVNLANLHRTALAIECSDGTMTADTDNERLGLAAPEEYADDRLVQSVSARVLDDVTGTVTIVYRRISTYFPAGATVIFTGICTQGEMIWSVGGTVPEKFLPRT